MGLLGTLAPLLFAAIYLLAFTITPVVLARQLYIGKTTTKLIKIFGTIPIGFVLLRGLLQFIKFFLEWRVCFLSTYQIFEYDQIFQLKKTINVFNSIDTVISIILIAVGFLPIISWIILFVDMIKDKCFSSKNEAIPPFVQISIYAIEFISLFLPITNHYGLFDSRNNSFFDLFKYSYAKFLNGIIQDGIIQDGIIDTTFITMILFITMFFIIIIGIILNIIFRDLRKTILYDLLAQFIYLIIILATSQDLMDEMSLCFLAMYILSILSNIYVVVIYSWSIEKTHQNTMKSTNYGQL